MTVTINGSGSITEEITIDGVTVGQGGGNVSTNTAVGASALDANTSGAYNVALGTDALGANTTASNNTAVGYQALYANTTGAGNTVVGDQAGKALTVNNGCTFIGQESGLSTTGGYNTFLGEDSGWQVTTGTKNTIIGRYSGNAGGLDIRTSSNYIVLSDGDGNPRGFFDNVGNWTVNGPYANPPTDSFVRNTTSGIVQSGRTGTGSQPMVEFFNGNGVVGSIYTSGSATAYNTSSDYRLKEDWQPMSGATERLKQLKPVNFAWKSDGTRVDGFLAHEAAEVVPEAVTGEKDALDDEGNPIYQGIDQSKLVPLLVATIQELEARIAALEATP